MAVLMGRLDGGTPARIFASLIFLENPLSGRAGGGKMPSGRYAFDPQWVVMVFRPFGGGGRG